MISNSSWKTSYFFLVLSALALLLCPSHVKASDAKKPHYHRGYLEPYKQETPTVDLDAAAKAKLAKGQAVRFQIKDGKGGGRGIVVQDVHAPVDVVMGKILDFPNYPKMVGNVAACGNYEVKNLDSKDVEMKTRFQLSFIGIKLEYFIRHIYRPSINTITWTLDYDRLSDFDDSVGYWSVAPSDRDGGDWSRIYYSIDLRVPDWIPRIVVNILETQALTMATAWVKTYSEKAHNAELAMKKQKEAAAPETVVAGGLAGGAAAGAAAAGEAVGGTGSEGKTKYGRGSLFEAFVEEYSDLIDTKKLAERVERKRAKKATTTPSSSSSHSQQQQPTAKEPKKEKKGWGRREKKPATTIQPPDDATNVLWCVWTACIIFFLLRVSQGKILIRRSKVSLASH